MNLGTIYFHHVTDVKAYPLHTSRGVSIHVTHGMHTTRTDELCLFNVPSAELLKLFPSTGDEPRNIFSPIPSFHGPTLVSASRDEIQFEEFPVHFFWKEAS